MYKNKVLLEPHGPMGLRGSLFL